MKYNMLKNIIYLFVYSFFIFSNLFVFSCFAMHEDQISSSPTATSSLMYYYEKASRHYNMDPNHEAMTIGTYLETNYDKNTYATERNRTLSLLEKKDRGEQLSKEESQTYGRRIARTESVPKDILSLNNPPDVKKDQFTRLKDTMGNHIPEPVDTTIIENVKKFYMLDLANLINKISLSIESTPEYIVQNSDKKFGKEIGELIPQIQTIKTELTNIKNKVVPQKEDPDSIKNKIIELNQFLEPINPEIINDFQDELIQLYTTIQVLLNLQTNQSENENTDNEQINMDEKIERNESNSETSTDNIEE